MPLPATPSPVADPCAPLFLRRHSSRSRSPPAMHSSIHSMSFSITQRTPPEKILLQLAQLVRHIFGQHGIGRLAKKAQRVANIIARTAC